MTPNDSPCLSQLSIKTRIETRQAQRGSSASPRLSQLSIKTRIETPCSDRPDEESETFESAIH